VSLRTTIAVALVALAVLTGAAIGWFSYSATGNRLEAEVDRSISDVARGFARRLSEGQPVDISRPGLGGFPGRPGRDDDDGEEERYPEVDVVSVQAITAEGSVVASSGSLEVPVAPGDIAVAAAGRQGTQRFADATVDGEHVRYTTASVEGGGAVQSARSMAETDRVLESLRNQILVALVVVAAVAALLGWLVGRQVTRRLRTVTAAAEEVAETGRLDVEVPVEGSDEAGRLGVTFNRMLGALKSSKEAQQRLVQDAGHELRTPLTSLRTNISVLRRHDRLPPATLGKLLDDLDGEARELTDLVNELVDLATDRGRDEPVAPVALAEVCERVAERARRRTGRTVTVTADATVVDGRAAALERAVSNLVDNALKFDDAGGAVEVVQAGGRVAVLDRGPGIDPDDLPHVFDRFYRATAARSRPGSGLGLAIVADVAERHGGSVFAEPRDGGGSVIGFVVPAPLPPPAPEPVATVEPGVAPAADPAGP
jgi:two-component system, OmpR family, sensor histidine kinase MprB